MSMKWAIQSQTMQAAESKRKRKEEDRERFHKLKYCKNCNIVYKKSDFQFRQHSGRPEERYDEGSMPTYKLDRKTCENCIGKMKGKINE